MKKQVWAGFIGLLGVCATVGITQKDVFAGDSTDSYYIEAGKTESILLKEENVDGLSWDDEKNVLVLDNFKGNGAFGFFAKESESDDSYTEIVLKGNNTITLADDGILPKSTYYAHKAVLYGLEGGIKISGSGTLNVEVPEEMTGIYSIGNVTIDSATINFKVRGGEGKVIEAYDTCFVKKAKLNMDMACGIVEDEDEVVTVKFKGAVKGDKIDFSDSNVTLNYNSLTGSKTPSTSYALSAYNFDIKNTPIIINAKEADRKYIKPIHYLDSFVAKETIDTVVATKGMKIEDKYFTYRVTKAGTTTGTVGTVSILRFRDKSYKSIVIKPYVTIYGVKYKVTGVISNAFKNDKKLKKVTIKSKFIKTIGKRAFYRKKGKKLTFVLPKSKKKAYAKKLKKAKTNNYKIK